MKEYTTEKGTKLYYDVTYDLGGYNYFTDKLEPRCYSLNINRDPQGFAAFSDLNDERGAERMVLFEVGRKSKKQLAKAESIALDTLKKYVSENYSNL